MPFSHSLWLPVHSVVRCAAGTALFNTNWCGIADVLYVWNRFCVRNLRSLINLIALSCNKYTSHRLWLTDSQLLRQAALLFTQINCLCPLSPPLALSRFLPFPDSPLPGVFYCRNCFLFIPVDENKIQPRQTDDKREATYPFNQHTAQTRR